MKTIHKLNNKHYLELDNWDLELCELIDNSFPTQVPIVWYPKTNVLDIDYWICDKCWGKKNQSWCTNMACNIEYTNWEKHGIYFKIDPTLSQLQQSVWKQQQNSE